MLGTNAQLSQAHIEQAHIEDDTILDGEEILTIQDLTVEFRRGGMRTKGVRGLNLALQAGKIVGVAGESGSGKTATALATMGLLPTGTVVTGSIRYRGQELIGMPERQLRRLRGGDIAMIFQETATALNPVIRVGDQLAMAARAHHKGSKQALRQRVINALDAVRLPDHDRVLRSYPHELSGGMCQRVVIAMAVTCGSKVLLADEPTTALDVSVQEEILQLIRSLVKERNLAVMMISHDLAVLSELCDSLVIMYKGEEVEAGPAGAVLAAPAHPYTRALLDCLPRLHGPKVELPDLAPSGDNPGDTGCRFRGRCSWRADVCEAHPGLDTLAANPARAARCWRAIEVLAASELDGDSRG